MAANSGVRILLRIPLDFSNGQKIESRNEKPKHSGISAGSHRIDEPN
jgi:hypothetical protein